MLSEFQTIREQLEKMEAQMSAGFAVIKTDIVGLKTEVGELKTDVKRLGEEQEKHFTALKEDVDAVQEEIKRLDSRVERFDTSVRDLEFDVKLVKHVTSTTLEIIQGEQEERVNLDGRIGILEEDMVTVKEKVGLKAVNAAV